MDTFSNKREINCCSYHNIFPVCVAVPLAIVLVLVKKVVIVIVLLCMEYMDNLNSGIAVESRGNSRRSTFLESLDLFRVSLLRVEYSKASSMATNSESSSSLGDDWAISSLWDCHQPSLEVGGMEGGEAALRQKCKALKDEYDTLHKCYADLVQVHSSHVSKMELSQEDMARLKKQLDDAKRERDAALRECAGLQQQCTAAIRQWDNALRERNDAREQLQRTQQQRDDAMKEINQAMAIRLKAGKDLNRLTEERNAAVQEYALIMSERDSVHKEMEKFQEELATKNSELSTSENKIKSLQDENEGLKREIASALQDRDRALKECNQLRECSPLQKQHEQDSQAYKDQIEALHKEVTKLKNELTEAQQEAEVSKRRRDWAFSERDKIVLERESIRALCDRLRKERDRAVSELAEALRDSDDAKRQANKELNELRQMQLGVALSKDSAIDIMEEFEASTKTVKLKLDGLENGGGFETCKNNDTLWVSRIEAGGPADGKLLLQDQIIKINGASVFQMGVEVAQEMLQKATDYLKLEVRRRASSQHKHSSRRGYFFCELQIPEKETHGLVLEAGVYVAQTVPGTPGAQVLQAGDRILSIDGQVVTDMQLALEKLDKPGRFQLQVCRFGNSINSSSKNDDTKDRSANIILKQFSSVCVQTDEKLAKTLVSPSEKKASNTLLDRAKNKIFGEKKSTRPLSTIQSSNDTKEAIFELDSVIDRFSSERKSAKSHKGSSTSSSKENHRGTSSAPNNGGTWPKYKGALTEHQLQAGEKVSLNVNTLQTTHKRKERKSIPKQFYHSSSDSSPVSSGSSPIKMDAYVPQTSSEILREFNSLVQTAPSSRNHSQDRYYSMTTPRPHSKPLAVKGSSGLVTAQTSSMQVSTRPRSAHYTASILDGSYGSHYGAHSAGNGSVKESAYEMILPAPLEPSALNSLNPLNTLNPLNPHGALGGHGTHSAASHHGGHGGAHNPLYPNYYTTGSSHSTRHAISAVGHVGPVCCPPGPGPYMSRSGDSLLSAGAESSSTNTFTPSTGYGIKDSSHYSGGSYTPSPCPSSLAAYQTSYSPTYGIEFGHFHGAPYPGPHVPPIPPLHADHGALGGTHAHVHGAHMSVMHASGGVGGTGIGGGAPTTADVGVSIAGLATFPKRQQRIRIPSTPSVSSSAGRVSTGSIDREHQHRPASPLQPALTVELINSSGGDIELNPKNRKPKAGDTRRIIIEKSKEPLGIQIKGGAGQSIFVSSVTENSLAEKAGLQIGDQLLEVCGINMRNATYQLAANVLRQCRDSMTMLVQFNPDKYREGCSTPGGASSSASESPPDTPHASPKTQYRQSQSGTAGSGPNVTMATGGVVVVSGSGNGSSSVTKRHRSPGAAGPSVCVDAREARSRSNDDLSSAGGNSTLTRSSHKSVGGGVGGTVYLPQPLQAHGHSHTKMVGSGGEPSSGNSGGSKREPTAVSSIGAVGSSVSKGGVRCDSSKPTEPRVVVLNKPSSSNLGITLLGGNAVGIFVHSVEPDSPAATGLRPGDQILEYNGIDLRNFTAEDAASELAKPTGESAQLKVLVQENMERYMEIQEYGSGDAFYVRALFDRPATDGSLPIKKDDVFFVDNTMYKGVNGLWRAWLVDQEGRKSRCGFIPSRYKAEEELVLRRSLLDMAADEAGRRGSARRSFFRRRSKNASTREIAAYSDASINSSSYSAGSAASMLAADELLPPPTYQRVEKLCYTSFRPVILIGPLNDAVMEKLEQDYPDMFQRCLAEAMRGTPHLMEKGVSELKILDFQRRGSHFECTTISAIKAICEQSHAFLDVSLSLDVIIERLKKCQIYPIVIFIKFKSTKQIREVKDCRYLTEKMTTKAAKEMFEHSVKIESEYKHLINGVIQGNNLTYMCTQVKTCVEDQQNKTVWISTASVQY
ncbi:disks large homolog 5-like isoform X5 [Varroa destructor]|uniref:Disks large homolog 5 n=1 Tax=Varroa destructor TaxID=109461 RepID=A0A7M7MC52_VARDE|nr:disks large homolog 5-like isoform X5 [Varroa destructor]